MQRWPLEMPSGSVRGAGNTRQWRAASNRQSHLSCHSPPVGKRFHPISLCPVIAALAVVLAARGTPLLTRCLGPSRYNERVRLVSGSATEAAEWDDRAKQYSPSSYLWHSLLIGAALTAGGSIIGLALQGRAFSAACANKCAFDQQYQVGDGARWRMQG